MARPRKKGQAVSLLMDKELFKQLEEYCDKTFLTKTGAIEKAVKEMIEKDKQNK